MEKNLHDTPPGLLPCPFCGTAPVEDRIEPHKHYIVQMPDYPGSWSIECVKCEFRIFDHDARENAVRKWNTRQTRSESGQGVDALAIAQSLRTRIESLPYFEELKLPEVKVRSNEIYKLRKEATELVQALLSTRSASGAIEKMNEAIGRGLNHVFFEDGLSADLHDLSKAEAYREGWRDAWLEMADDLAAIDSRILPDK